MKVLPLMARRQLCDQKKSITSLEMSTPRARTARLDSPVRIAESARRSRPSVVMPTAGQEEIDNLVGLVYTKCQFCPAQLASAKCRLCPAKNSPARKAKTARQDTSARSARMAEVAMEVATMSSSPAGIRRLIVKPTVRHEEINCLGGLANPSSCQLWDRRKSITSLDSPSRKAKSVRHNSPARNAASARQDSPARNADAARQDSPARSADPAR